jgi:hypothetical protein
MMPKEPFEIYTLRLTVLSSLNRAVSNLTTPIDESDRTPPIHPTQIRATIDNRPNKQN